MLNGKFKFLKKKMVYLLRKLRGKKKKKESENSIINHTYYCFMLEINIP